MAMIHRSCAAGGLGLLLAISGLHSDAAAQSATASRTRSHVTALASEQLEGRLAGSNGERLAADYLVSQLERIGARSLPGTQDFRLPFEFTAGTRDGGSSLSLTCAEKEKDGTAGRCGSTFGAGAISALSFADDREVSGPAVFAGYGIVVPDSQDFGYDSYAGLDVKDKVVIVLRYFPEDADAKTKTLLARYADLRYKAMAARQRGARAILIVAGPRSPNAGELIPMAFDTALAGSGIVAASITGAVASSILDGTGRALADVQQSLDSANPHVAGFEIPGKVVSVKTSVIREKRTGHNIVAYLPATGSTDGVTKPWIALGAHYDHLGHGETGGSLADQKDAKRVHPGADDNASGSAAVLAVGEILSTQPRRRNVMLQFWSAEEIGLIGSAAFASKPPVPLDQIAAYINFDMVGRMQDNKLVVQATGTSAAWPRIIEQANIAAGFDLQVQADPYQPTDVATFNQASIPSINFFTGSHADYHRPTDTADRIAYDDLDRVVEFAAAIARRVSDMPEALTFTKVEQTTSGATRGGLRIFTGTIPDYATEAKGLLLSGVIGGGPAEQAGLQKGDLIVEIAGHTIANVYDYTYALDLLKVGEPAHVVYMRAGERRETKLTPAARK
jgi:Zn-dependent M28 family amino/carboxypeptidase